MQEFMVLCSISLNIVPGIDGKGKYIIICTLSYTIMIWLQEYVNKEKMN